MDNFSIDYSEEALADLKSIYEYIAFHLHVPATATAQVNRIRASIRSLDTFPQRNKIVDWSPWSELQVRQSRVDNFRVFYLVDDDSSTISILRIFYAKRDIPSLAKTGLSYSSIPPLHKTDDD